jgi:hypothetical protein
MSFTYAQLKQALRDFLETEEPTFVNNLPLFIRSAEERILKSVQLNLFRRNATATAAAGSQYLITPLDFLAPLSLSYMGSDNDKVFLDFKDVTFVQAYNPDSSTTGAPRYYAQFNNETFILGPAPAENYQMELHYFYRPASLTAGAEDGTTWLSVNAELSLLYGSIMEAYIFLKGDADMMAVYDKRYQESLIGLKLLGEAKQVTDEFRTGPVVRPKA